MTPEDSKNGALMANSSLNISASKLFSYTLSIVIDSLASN